MKQIKDRVLLGVIGGAVGNIAKTIADESSLRMKISQRSFRATAAGVWVKKKSDADSTLGQLLGGLFDFGMASIGGIGTVYLLTKSGRDHLIAKGLVSGITIGSIINALLSALPQNKVQPKDAASNLSYMVSHAVYGLVAIGTISALGDRSLFDTKPTNDYMQPTRMTTEQAKENIDPIITKRDDSKSDSIADPYVY